MNQLKVENYNFHTTLLGGQAFGWDYDERTNSYYGVTNSRYIEVKVVDKENVLWQTYPVLNDVEYISTYLNLNLNYDEILKSFPKDKYLEKAKEKYFGLRILKQDFEECLFSYICSTNKSIKGIRYSYRLLCKNFGEKINVDGNEVHLFPKAEVLAKAKLSEILETKVGFRAKYLKEASEYLVNTGLRKRIHNLNYDEAKAEIIKLRGVGDKVADCVLAYSLGFKDITPLDIWGKRFLIQYYGLNPKMKYFEMMEWVRKYFKGNASYAGQYLFEYIRKGV